MTFTSPPPDMQGRQPDKTEQQRRIACAILGLDPEVDHSEKQINYAFRVTAKIKHPDTGGPGFDIDELKGARRTLLQFVNQETTQPETKTCPACGGRGNLLIGFKSEPCATCAGTGEVGANDGTS